MFESLAVKIRNTGSVHTLVHTSRSILLSVNFPKKNREVRVSENLGCVMFLHVS